MRSLLIKILKRDTSKNIDGKKKLMFIITATKEKGNNAICKKEKYNETQHTPNTKQKTQFRANPKKEKFDMEMDNKKEELNGKKREKKRWTSHENLSL